MNPIMQQWSFTLEQQLSNDWAVRASYIGAQTHHMFWYAGDINKPNVQQPNVPLQSQRPYQPWGQINATQGGGSINFNQIQLEVNKRFSRRVSCSKLSINSRVVLTTFLSLVAHRIPTITRLNTGTPTPFQDRC